MTLVLLAGVALCAATGFISRREWVRSALLALASVLITLVAFEVYVCATAAPRDFRVGYQDSYRAVKRPLGRGPAGPGQYRSSTVMATTGSTVYDVVYSIGPHGFRSTRGGGPGADTYLFFGGSFTFGEGDDETYPARFSEALGFASTVVSISFEGYGPHQMLRALELGLPDQAITGEARRVFYLALWSHTDRAAGLYWWNIHSPRYALDERGGLISAGFFRADWRWRLLAALDKQGGLTELLGEGIQSVLLPIDGRIALTSAIIERASRIHGTLGPGAKWRPAVVRDRSECPAPTPSTPPRLAALHQDLAPLRERYLCWADLMARVFELDVLDAPAAREGVR